MTSYSYTSLNSGQCLSPSPVHFGYCKIGINLHVFYYMYLDTACFGLLMRKKDGFMFVIALQLFTMSWTRFKPRVCCQFG